METHDSYTRLLGLALRGGNLVAGNDPVQAAVYAGRVRLLLLSADASARTCRDAEQWAERGHCLCVVLPCGKAELGHALGHAEVAVAALTDTGLANAVGERLAAFDPDRYAYLSERLKRKVARAGERRAARARARPDAVKLRPNATRKPHTDVARKPRPDGAKTTTARPNSTKTTKPRSGDKKTRPDGVKMAKARPNSAKTTKPPSGDRKPRPASGAAPKRRKRPDT